MALSGLCGTTKRVAPVLLTWLFLIVLTWLAHFSQSRNIGFYSDDHSFATEPLNWTGQTYKDWLRGEVSRYPEPQGRTLGFVLGVSLAYAGDRMAGLDGMFLIAWWILSVNAILFYHLLRRCFSPPLPMLGAMIFVLFPPDTTRPYLCHAHILQPSLMFMLIAAHLWLRGSLLRKIATYLLLGLCLITYETAILPFLAIPLLETARDRRWMKGFAINIVAVVVLMGAVGLSRKLGHEDRAAQITIGKISLLFHILGGLVIGPAAAFAAFFWRIWIAVRFLVSQPQELLILLPAVAMFASVIWLVSTDKGKMLRVGIWTRHTVEGHLTELDRAVQFGVVAVIASYLLSFTHFPPFWMNGQLTSVHVATSVGGSTLFAAAGAWLWTRRSRATAITIFSIYLGMLFIWSQAEQDDYVIAWQRRQQFWARVTDLCPDLTDSTLIICDGKLADPDHVMFLNCWSDSFVLRQMFKFPATFQLDPELDCFLPDDTGHGWRAALARDPAGKIVWTDPPYLRKPGAELVEGNTILLHMDESSHLRRDTGTVEVLGKPFKLKECAGMVNYPRLRLHDMLTAAKR